MSRQHPDIKSRLATNIANAIELSGLSIVEVARRMNGNERAVRRWRDGEVSPSQENLARLATVLDVPDLTWFYMPHDDEPVGAAA